MAKTSPQPVVLRENSIIDGNFYAAGSALPFTREEDLPEPLRNSVARGGEVFFNPRERNLYAEGTPAEFATPLPAEIEAELEVAHIRRISLLKAQAEASQGAVDAVYARVEAEAAAKVVKHFVRRGGAWGHVENANLKPGEPVYVRRESGEMETVGHIDSQGGWPEPEIIT